jgi:hypothetical protein
MFIESAVQKGVRGMNGDLKKDAGEGRGKWVERGRGNWECDRGVDRGRGRSGQDRAYGSRARGGNAEGRGQFGRGVWERRGGGGGAQGGEWAHEDRLAAAAKAAGEGFV